MHARVRCLQAIDRPHHRPAPRRDPGLLPVSRAAEPLSRSARHARCESPVTPQAASIYDELRRRLWRCDHRPTAAICEDKNFRVVRHSGIIKIGTYCRNIELQVLRPLNANYRVIRKSTRSDNQKRDEGRFAEPRITVSTPFCSRLDCIAHA